MATRTLTDRLIRSLKTKKSQEDFWDASFTGASFGIRVTSSGLKTFILRYRANGKRRRLTLGRYPLISLHAARREALHHLVKLTEGIDPQQKREQIVLAETVSEVFEAFFEHRDGRISPETLKRYRGMYRREIKDTLGQIKALELKKAHVIPVLQKISEKTPTQAERVRALLLAAMNYAVSVDLIDFNPLLNIPNYGHTRIGERYLSREEIKNYLKGTGELFPIERVYFRLLLFLGMRPGELAALRWDFISNDLLTIPADYQKNSRTLVLPLVKSIAEEINQLRIAIGGSKYLFPSPDGSSARQSFNKHKKKLEAFVCGSHWTLRDIRRTTETHMRELGISPDTVASLLNHNTGSLRKIYDKSHQIREKKLALEAWCEWLEKINLPHTRHERRLSRPSRT